MFISLMDNFYTQVSTINNITQSVNYMTLRIYYGLIKIKSIKLNSIVDSLKSMNQIPTTGNATRKKCKNRELLKDEYWKITLPKYP